MLIYSIIIITKRISSYCLPPGETRKMCITTPSKCYLSRHRTMSLFFLKNQINTQCYRLTFSFLIHIAVSVYFQFLILLFIFFVRFYCEFYLLTTIIGLAYYAQYTVFALQIFPIIVFKIYIKFNDVLMVSLCTPIITVTLAVSTKFLKRNFIPL